MTRSIWEALDSDTVDREHVDLQVCIQEGDIQKIIVNDDWNLGNVSYALQFEARVLFCN